MSLTNPTNVVTEQRLAEFYQAIFPYLGGYGGTGIDYTETERLVGTWIDGKPLYQKTVDCGLMVNDTNWHDIAHGISNLSKVIYIDGIAVDELSSTPMFYAGLTYRPFTNVGICIMVQDSLIRYMNTWITDRCARLYATVQYTKTTDTAGTKKYLGVPAVHYTTDEQVIGTWIDGKPLYQKTINIGHNYGTVSSNVRPINYTIPQSMNVDKVISCTGYDMIGRTLPYMNQTIEYSEYLYCSDEENYIYLRTGSGLSYDKDVYVTIQYTKTTD